MDKSQGYALLSYNSNTKSGNRSGILRCEANGGACSQSLSIRGDVPRHYQKYGQQSRRQTQTRHNRHIGRRNDLGLLYVVWPVGVYRLSFLWGCAFAPDCAPDILHRWQFLSGEVAHHRRHKARLRVFLDSVSAWIFSLTNQLSVAGLTNMVNFP